MVEFDIDIQNPVQQIVALFIFGLLVGVFFVGWLRWVIWIGGIVALIYLNWFAKGKEGAVKEGDLRWKEREKKDDEHGWVKVK